MSVLKRSSLNWEQTSNALIITLQTEPEDAVNTYYLKDLRGNTRRKILQRAETNIRELITQVQPIVEEVRQKGDEALLKYSREFDKVQFSCKEDLVVSSEEINSALGSLDSALKEAIEKSLENIIRFHQHQMPQELWLTQLGPGIMAGEKTTPIESVGLYVPRGKGSFPSVMMMLATPAMVAKVEKVIVCTPPNPDGSVDAASLVAARKCGVKEIFKVGGAQAIAAMAFGTETIPRVSKIIGPGSPYVSAAKRILYGTVDVGLPAGPSEALIVADEMADPLTVALDLLIEAEHGPDSSVFLVTHSEKLVNEVKQALPGLLAELPEWRQSFCEKVFQEYGGAIITSNLDESLGFVNDYAPEHLELLVNEPFVALEKVKHAGEILLGKNTPITISNFSLGPNAILPTGGFAKTFSAVSVRDFLKSSSIAYLTEVGYDTLKPWALKLAEYEGFPAHALALKRRFS
ncbi:MAG: histidinol dehydrogenase [Candidatus Tectomicrobia bacterium]|uniref:Histidinol dehydrogenase n=1 Tax=Tectimicrobiota bacterium TaxID=2528274 RepID=A0A933GM89_UNCTE|nr:histidinol dehydrogenase [Candidatus Tectomicrobia bacterium]